MFSLSCGKGKEEFITAHKNKPMGLTKGEEYQGTRIRR